MKNEMVKYDNRMNKLNFGVLTVVEKNMFFALCARVRQQGDRKIEFTFDELKKIIDYKPTSNVRFIKDLRKMNKKLASLLFDMKDDGAYLDFVLFPTFRTDPNTKILTVSVNEDFLDLFNDPRFYTEYELAEYLEIKNNYAKGLYSLLRQFKTTGFYVVTPEKFRFLLDVPEKHRIPEINRYVLKPAIAELSKYFKGLRVELIKEGRGNKVVRFEFKFQKQKTLQEIKDVTPKTKRKNKVKAHEQQAIERNESPESRAESPMPADVAAALEERIKNLRSSGKTFE